MKKVKSIIAVIIFSIYLLLFCSATLAFEFENYEWGQSIENVKKQLKNEQKKLKSRFTNENNPTTLLYSDTIFGSRCEVDLNFTKTTKQLAFLAIKWDDSSAEDRIYKALTEKYGNPTPMCSSLDYCYWGNFSKKDAITLNRSISGIELIYYGGEYFKKYMEEGSNKKGNYKGMKKH